MCILCSTDDSRRAFRRKLADGEALVRTLLCIVLLEKKIGPGKICLSKPHFFSPPSLGWGYG